jgi:alcohol dehydrogenase
MRAAIYHAFGGPLEVVEVDDPVPGVDSVILHVQANGICRSDWHAWMGHDAVVRLPHVPGHEMAGVVAEVGRHVSKFRVGDRVTVPFACGCGVCRYCRKGQLHICDHDFQPGFTHWGAFAELVEIHYAEHNLVRLPPELDFVTTASLGCRFATAFRAVMHQGAVNEGDWLAVHGCGGLGLSVIMIGAVMGARVISVDIDHDKLRFASKLGAEVLINAAETSDVVGQILDVTQGGADVSVDALGSRITATNSILCLRKQARHVQAGLLLGKEADPPLPMGRVISHELHLVGSHGMSATDYAPLLELVTSKRLDPHQLVGRTVPLTEACQVLETMGDFPYLGVTVIDDFKS